MLRNRKIGEMRENGFSYERIAILLKIPRATVQSAAAAYEKQKICELI
jgi:DNA-directed RNA polymerase specialized sigma24 family protein